MYWWKHTWWIQMAAPSQAPLSLQEWSAEFELTDETLDALKSKGLNSHKSIVRLTSEVTKKDFGKSINTAQFLLLNDAVASLQTSQQNRNQRDDDNSRTNFDEAYRHFRQLTQDEVEEPRSSSTGSINNSTG